MHFNGIPVLTGLDCCYAAVTYVAYGHSPAAVIHPCVVPVRKSGAIALLSWCPIAGHAFVTKASVAECTTT